MGLSAQLLWCSSCPLHWDKGWVRDSMVSEQRLQQWASMGQEDAVTEAELPSVQHRSEFEMAAANFKHLPKC